MRLLCALMTVTFLCCMVADAYPQDSVMGQLCPILQDFVTSVSLFLNNATEPVAWDQWAQIDVNFRMKLQNLANSLAEDDSRGSVAINELMATAEIWKRQMLATWQTRDFQDDQVLWKAWGMLQNVCPSLALPQL
ncbi:hypothetical protein Desti_2500 [Desulfomonile tiedjei DSM 6799]|uniref:Uncharacterized protein n=2 Tax=Desulfomonile tiedjei TaxID=2358 RepID=I4C6I9_DESTA|nr:hypothetical protein Desti_2500 [Desulfomonile tiedjei DSM 6799]